ncbi:hypothetical protein L0U85_02990 [Glycomyces sp. L485]|uniref:hypothetical protein n=1 Tax=Glycomyces sp. L485 TaxID=2909235 RepID=UPI001F4BC03D|nr:hypothetical protein [Glycomyces sp. L485]MCH7229830.1 hypothetical protein [Glycomyces sp. L485]
MTYLPPGGNPPPPGYGQQPQQPGYPPQQGGYPQQQQPTQPPPGYGQQPGYPPPQQPGYGAPPPPPATPAPGGGGGFGDFAKSTGKGLLWKLGGLALVLVVGGVVVLVKVLGGESVGQAIDSLDDDKISPSASEGDCLIEDWDTSAEDGAASDPTDGLVVDCSADEAFWEITKVDTDIQTEVDITGDVESLDEFTELCGAEIMSYQHGQVWKDFYYVYTEADFYIDYAFCLQAVDKANAEGQAPRMPDVDECFDNDPDYWYTVDCSSPNAVGEVADVIAVDPPAEMTEDELYTKATDECTAGDSYAWLSERPADSLAVENSTAVTSLFCYTAL